MIPDPRQEAIEEAVLSVTGLRAGADRIFAEAVARAALARLDAADRARTVPLRDVVARMMLDDAYAYGDRPHGWDDSGEDVRGTYRALADRVLAAVHAPPDLTGYAYRATEALRALVGQITDSVLAGGLVLTEHGTEVVADARAITSRCPGCGQGGSDPGGIERAATPEEVDAGCELGIAYDPCPTPWFHVRPDVTP